MSFRAPHASPMKVLEGRPLTSVMLSKKAARLFFLTGTALCSLAFVGLTVDTFSRIPAQTHADRLTPAAIRGKHLWDRNNCMGCHTLMGEGAYYAPELTRVYRRRGPDFIRAMLRDPEAMYPGQRRMVNYHFTPAQIDDLVAFLQWIDGVDLNGFPASPDAQPGGRPRRGSVAPPSTAAGVQPALRRVPPARRTGRRGGPRPRRRRRAPRRRLPPALAARPAAVKPGTAMPRLPLTEPQVRELVAFLTHLRPEVRP
jgi:nitric oxide reductase subunit C